MVSPVTHAAGTSASKARSSIPLASSGLVANSTSLGMPASARRSASFTQLFLGRYKARSTKAAPVDDEHRPLVCEVLDYVFAQVVSDLLGVPLRLVEQPLHTIGGAISNGLGHLPAVLTLHRSGESLQVSQRSSQRFGTPEAMGDPAVKPFEFPCPSSGRLYHRRTSRSIRHHGESYPS